MLKLTLLQGDALAVLKTLPSDSVHCCVTSPPYYGLRDYGVDGQIGLEPTLDAYLSRLVAVFAEVRRVLHPSGVCFVNMGDSYAGSWGNYGGQNRGHGTQRDIVTGSQVPNPAYDGLEQMRPATSLPQPGLKPKDRLLVPFRLALLLQADGWWVRDIICWAKRAPMPESVTDRCTQSWEPIFMLTKAARYFWDAEAVKQPASDSYANDSRWKTGPTPENEKFGYAAAMAQNPKAVHRVFNGEQAQSTNLRNVWLLSPSPYPDAHFATFVPEIPKRCILAGTSAKGVCPKCGEPWVRVVERTTGEPASFNGSRFDAGKTQEAREHLSAVGNGERTVASRTVGWSPGCACDGVDRRPVRSPLAERVGDDPSFETGRAGYNRPRHSEEGQRIITRYEQQQYAAQLKTGPQRPQMESEAGQSFAHYIRTDDSGARPIPDELLERWIENGWLQRVTLPETSPLGPIPATVLDPFAGSGTTLAVALELGRHAIGIELSPEYMKLAERRCAAVTPGLALA